MGTSYGGKPALGIGYNKATRWSLLDHQCAPHAESGNRRRFARLKAAYRGVGFFLETHPRRPLDLCAEDLRSPVHDSFCSKAIGEWDHMGVSVAFCGCCQHVVEMDSEQVVNGDRNIKTMKPIIQYVKEMSHYLAWLLFSSERLHFSSAIFIR